MNLYQKLQSDKILSCYQEANLEKGGKRAVIGEVRRHGGEDFRKTANGDWEEVKTSSKDKKETSITSKSSEGWETEGEAFILKRKELKIPPAWQEVKISSDPNADLVATGRDTKGRRQYIYSENATMRQAALKFAKNKELIGKQSIITEQNNKNTLSPDFKVSESAKVISLILATGIRPGSERETQSKVKAYGATTLEGKHVVEENGKVRLNFIGKKGVSIDILIQDPKIAKLLLERRKEKGEDGKLFNVSDIDLRNYTKTLESGKFNPKDFRTLKGTSTALEEVKKLQRAKSMDEYKKQVTDIAKKVASILGNTPIIALNSYINPFVFLSIQPI